MVLAGESDSIEVSVTPGFSEEEEDPPLGNLGGNLGNLNSGVRTLAQVLPYVFVGIGMVAALAATAIGGLFTGILTAAIVVILTIAGTGIIQGLLGSI